MEMGERLQLSSHEVRSFLLAGERNADGASGDQNGSEQNNDQKQAGARGSEGSSLVG